MALNATTLTAAITSVQTTFAIGSTTGIVTPNFTAVPAGQVNASITYLLVEQEMMQVQSVNTTTLVVTVTRGQLGTAQVPHGVSCPVLSGTPIDFWTFVPPQKSDVPFLPFGSVAFGAPLTGATITPTAAYQHFTGTVALITINLPNYVNLPGGYGGYYPENPIAGMQIALVFDGSSTGLTWTAAGNINVAGTSGTAGTMVFFTYDPSISKWIPSRIL
jgi:hypothetical protein